MTTLARAYFQRLPEPGASSGPRVTVQFNPSELVFNKGAQLVEIPIPGLDSPLLQFVRGQTETLTLTLFFDTTDDGTGVGAKSVTAKTDPFYDLVKVDPATHAPPVLLFSWGGTAFPGKDRNSFRCVVQSVRQQYTFFSPDGTPLRALLTVELREYKTLTQQMRELNLQSADHTKALVVEDGTTITGASHRAFGDGRQWRLLADENDIVDPLALRPGTVLRVPRAS
jgi:Contractile injection system tube protein